MTDHPAIRDLCEPLALGFDHDDAMPALAWPRADSPDGWTQGVFCPYCEDWHLHDCSDASDEPPAIGSFRLVSSRCISAGGSIFHNGPYELLTVAHCIEAPKRPFSATNGPFFRRLHDLAADCRRLLLNRMFCRHVNKALLISYEALRVDLSIRDLTSWSISHVHHPCEPTDWRDVASRGKSLFDLLLALNFGSAYGLADMIFSAIDPSLEGYEREQIGRIVGEWHDSGMPTRPTIDSGQDGGAHISDWVKANQIGLPYPNGSLQGAISLAAADMMLLLSARCLPAGVALRGGESAIDAVSRLWSLPRALVVVRCFEALTGAVLNKGTLRNILSVANGYRPIWLLSEATNESVTEAAAMRPVMPLPGLDELLGDDFEDGEDEVPA